MSDFTYDSLDITAIRIATTNLSNSQCKALTIFGSTFAISLALQYFCRNNSYSIWNLRRSYLLGLSFGGSALGYSLYNYRAQAQFDRAAALINRKYTYLISSTLNYPL